MAVFCVYVLLCRYCSGDREGRRVPQIKVEATLPFQVLEVTPAVDLEVVVVVLDLEEELTLAAHKLFFLQGAAPPLRNIQIKLKSLLLDVKEKQRFSLLAKVSLLEKAKLHLKKLYGYIDLKKLFAPSTISAIIAFAVGIVSPIRKILIGDDAPLHAIYNSVHLIGEAAIPCMTLLIGANLLRGLKRSEVGPSIVLGIIAIRYIISPLLGIVIVKAANHFGMVGSDSLYQFTLMLQYALPPAMTVGTISQLLKTGESECSVIMLWTYVVASFSLTIWSTVFMWLVA
ncbi:protein pin-likes 3 [Quercus suber]|uniref:Protein pin-likes 3 n=1 Tax=Quercus suber TaxID=58331 RepID=A0AAW0L7G2_QUESU